MKRVLFFISVILLSCNSAKLQPAENALDALRNYKTACLQGDFDKAAFYITEDSKKKSDFVEAEKKFNKLSDAQKRESYAASLTIFSIKAKDNTTSIAVVKDSYNKTTDTITLIKQQQYWQVQLK